MIQAHILPTRLHAPITSNTDYYENQPPENLHNRYVLLLVMLVTMIPFFALAQAPQGSLTANGPFCGTGAGMLTWTASAGTGPFKVVYNDGIEERTSLLVTSGTAFAVFGAAVSATTTYNLVSVTDANGATRNSGFTKTSATIAISPKPTLQALPSSQTICSGNVISNIVLTADLPGSTITWKRDNPAGITGAGGLSLFSGSNNISGSFSSSLTVAQAVGLQATATLNACASTPVNFGITVNPVPLVNDIDSQVVCNNRLTNAIVFSGTAGSFNWTNSNTTIGLASSGTGNIPSFTAIRNGNGTARAIITVTPVIANGPSFCTGVSKSFSITVIPTAALTSSATQNVCSGTLFSYSPQTNARGVTTSFSWIRAQVSGVNNASATGFGDIAETLINTTKNPVNVTYVFTVTANGCTNPVTYNVVATVNPSPVISLSPSGTQTICNGSTITPVTISSPGSIAATIFSWSRTNGNAATGNIKGLPENGTGNTISGNLFNDTLYTDTTTFTAKATTNGCSAEKSFIVKVLAPIINNKLLNSQISEVTFCGLQKQITIAAPESKGGAGNFTYKWQVSSPGNNNYANIAGATDTAVAYFTSKDAWFRRIVVSGGCADTTNQKFEDAPGGNVSSIVGYCTGGSGVDISVKASYKGAIYTLQRHKNGIWENVPGRATIPGTGKVITFEKVANLATYRVTASIPNGCTVVVDGTVLIDANTLPGAPTSASATTPLVCAGDSTGIIGIIPGGSVNWYTVPSGGSPINETPVPSGDSYMVMPDTTTTYYAKSIFTNTGCKSSNRTSVQVIVNPTPAITSPASASICSGGTVSIPLTATWGASTSFTWQAADNPLTTGESTAVQQNATLLNTIANNSNATTTVEYTVIPAIQATGCTGKAQHVLVSVDPVPVVASQVASACNGALFSLQPANGGGSSIPASPATQYMWTLPTGNGFTGASAGSGTLISGKLFNAGTTPVTATYLVTPTGGACTGTPFTTTVTVNPSPVISNQSVAGACDGSFVLPPFTGANKIPAGTTYSWQQPTGTNIANLAAGVNQSTIYGRITNITKPTLPVTATYTIVPTSSPALGSCDGPAFTLVATITSSLAVDAAIWTGAVNSDWCNAGNWKCNIFPDLEKTAVIPTAAPHQPVISGSCIAVVNDIDVQGTASLDLQNGGELTVFGSFKNTDAARYQLNGNTTFAGVNQDIPGFVYHGLAINGGGRKTLQGPARITGNLLLHSGVVVTSTSKMLTISEAASITEGSSGSFIEGPLTRLTNTTGSYQFPVGVANSLRNAWVKLIAGTASSYTVQYHAAAPIFNSALTPALTAIQMNEYWQVLRNSGANAVLALDYKNPNALPASAGNSDWSNGKNPCPNCGVAVVQNDGSNNWRFTGLQNSGGFTVEQTTNWQVNKPVNSRELQNSFGQFTFGYADATVLAVQLLYFNGTINANDGILEWKFAPNSDVEATRLQHSSDGRRFNDLAVFQAGTTASYKHTNLVSGAHYYRLLLTDKTGKNTYSHTVLLVAGKNITVIKELVPTVVNQNTFATIYSAGNQSVSAMLTDITGRKVSMQTGSLVKGENRFKINTSHLARGIYQIFVQTADGATGNFRFLKE